MNVSRKAKHELSARWFANLNEVFPSLAPRTYLSKARWLSWLERRPVTAEVVGSSPIRVADIKHFVYNIYIYCGIIAQLGEHLPYKQRFIGSSPIGPIYMPMWLNWQSS